MKKSIAILLTVLMLIGLCACGKKNNGRRSLDKRSRTL